MAIAAWLVWRRAGMAAVAPISRKALIARMRRRSSGCLSMGMILGAAVTTFHLPSVRAAAPQAK